MDLPLSASCAGARRSGNQRSPLASATGSPESLWIKLNRGAIGDNYFLRLAQPTILAIIYATDSRNGHPNAPTCGWPSFASSRAKWAGGGIFATTSMVRSKRCPASGTNSISGAVFFELGLAMEKSAVDAARVSLGKAKSSVEAIRSAKQYPEFEAAWSDFLLAAGRIYSKLEQGAKNSGKSKAWFGRQKHARRTDTLLSYIHHARNADEHGIERVTQMQPGSIGIGSTGSTLIKRMVIDGNMVMADTVGDPLRVTVTPNSVRLVPVMDHGDRYEPPVSHLGSPINKPSPLAVAELAVSYLETLTDEAAKLS